MSKVRIASVKYQDARAFAELNGLGAHEWAWLGTTMALRGREPGEMYFVRGKAGDSGVMEDELSIWVRFKEGKVHRVDPLTKVKFA